MKKYLFVLGLCFMISSCSSQKFILEGNPTIPTKEGTSHFIFWGIGQEKTLDPSEVCPFGVAAVGSYTSFLNGLGAVLTFGIYQPQDYYIYCKKEKLK